MAGIRMTGLISNMDTESIVTQLMEAQRTKVTKIQNKKTKLEWSQDKWKDFNTKLYKLYQDQTSNLRLVGNYSTKKATSADESIAKITAENSATVGTHKVAIKQLASSQYVTSGQFAAGTTTGSKLTTALGMTAGTVIEIKSGIDSTTGEAKKSKSFTVTEDSTLNDFIKACNDAGLKASYDKTQRRLFINSESSGANQKFTITAGGISSYGSALNGMTDTEKSKFFDDIVNDESYYNTLTGDRKLLADLYKSNYDAINSTIDSKIANNDYVTTATKEVYNKVLETILAEGAASDSLTTTIKAADGTEYTIGNIKNKALIEEEADTEFEGIMANPGAATADQIDTIKAVGINLGIDVSDYDALTEDQKKQLKEGFLTRRSGENIGKQLDSIIANSNDIIKNYSDKAAVSDRTSQLASLKANTIKIASSDNVLAGLKLTNITGDATTDSTSGMNVVAAADCKAIYNGVELTSTTNTISANGLKIEAVGVSDKVGSDYKQTSITISNDSDAVYKKVKDFITQYNSILKELNDAYYADSARGYDPLTDEEKEAMTDDQIKMWEDKIKKSLLRRDSTLGSLTTAMKTAMSSTVKVNGTTYSLASFGIMTSTDYTEKGLLHIYGDKEDSTYSDKDDKLKAAIEADPDAFAEAFSGIVKNLHDTLYKKMAKTSISSALTFYNDKTIKNQISSYEKNISTLENKLSDMENRYYKQFSAMETALAKLQSQQSALSGLLGTS